jgi:hypothetical protein
MGAYYGYQVVNKENEINYSTFDLEAKLRLEKYSVGGMKFLESFYEKNPITQALYFILKKIGTPVVVNTICDYDEEDTFKKQLSWNSGFEKTSFDVKELGKFIRAKQKMEKEYNLTSNSMLGYIVCDSKKQYIDLYNFSNGMVISPLALLTRSSETSQGGGDFDVSDVDWKKLREENSNYREFQENLEFDKTLISSWVDLEIQFYEDDFHNPSEELQKKLKEYENISKKILLISRY